VPAPPAYLDECVDVALAEALRLRGFAVTLARDHGPLAASDELQIAYATSRGWAILSHNARHFQRWHRTFLEQRRPHGGVILIPDTGPLSRLKIRAVMMLDWVALQGGLPGEPLQMGPAPASPDQRLSTRRVSLLRG
jgi:hypothetical protein